MNKTLSWNLLWSQLENFVFVAAMLLAILMEGACVYWLATSGTMRAHSGVAMIAVPWGAPTLPQCWLLGALAMLGYRAAILVTLPKGGEECELRQRRHAFLRLWSWTVALGSLQLAALYLEQMTAGVR